MQSTGTAILLATHELAMVLASRLELLCTSIIAFNLGDWLPSGAGPLG